MAELPDRPRPYELVARTIAEEAPTMRDQLRESGARRVVTLGQEAADAFAAIFATERCSCVPITRTANLVRWLSPTAASTGCR